MRSLGRSISRIKDDVYHRRIKLDQAVAKVEEIKQKRLEYVKENLGLIKLLEEGKHVRAGITQDILDGVEDSDIDKELEDLAKKGESDWKRTLGI